MSNFPFSPKIRGDFKNLPTSTQAVAAAIHAKPIIVFTVTAQLFVNDLDEVVEPGTPDARPVQVPVDHYLRIDPSKLTIDLNNRIAAVGDRLTSAQRMIERVATSVGGEKSKLDVKDLPDERILMNVYAENDAAYDARLLAVVDRDENGQVAWTYTDANGNYVELDAKFLKANPRVGEQLQKGFREWYAPTKPSSGGATSPTKGDGVMGSENSQGQD